MGLGKKLWNLAERLAGTADRSVEKDLSPRGAARKLVDELGASGAPAARETFEPEDRPAGPPAQPIADERGEVRSRASVAGVELMTLPESQGPRPGDTIVPLASEEGGGRGDVGEEGDMDEADTEEVLAVGQGEEEETSTEFFTELDQLLAAVKQRGAYAFPAPANPSASEETKGALTEALREFNGGEFERLTLISLIGKIYAILGVYGFGPEKIEAFWPELKERQGEEKSGEKKFYFLEMGMNDDELIMAVFLRPKGRGEGSERLFQLVKPAYIKQWMVLSQVDADVTMIGDY